MSIIDVKLNQLKDVIIRNDIMDAYIFCIMVRCGEIGIKALETFHQHHPHLTVNIYCSDEDIQFIPQHDKQKIHVIDKNTNIYNGFNSGHLGTAMVYAKAILESPLNKIIHFDSDVYFRHNIIDTIIDKLDDHDIVGAIRNYKHNPNNRNDVRHLPDITQTYCFGFNKSKITITDFNLLTAMCQGNPVGLNHTVIDFFDPVAFHMINNGAKVYHIDNDIMGGCNYYGKRENKYLIPNKIFDVGDAIIHFAGIGSGQNFVKMTQEKRHINVPLSYVNWCIKRYDIYSKIFFKRPILPLNDEDDIIPEIEVLL